MIVNANYTWFKCLECDSITKILPGEKFENAEAIAKKFKCECSVATQKQKVKRNAT